MSRIIKFRGKRIDNGEWVYGDYYHNHFVDEYQIIVVIDCSTFKRYGVIPETVGQFTGLKDKNGKEIWKGDISIRYYNEHYPELRGVIEWDECEAKFVWHANFPNGGGANCGLGHYLNGHSDSHKEGESKQDEVIGNIHEEKSND